MRIYQADVWCDACGKVIEESLRAEGKAPEDAWDDGSYDSGQFPKPGDDHEPADCPQHCASGPTCLDPLTVQGEAYGALMGTLTADGEAYVKAAVLERPTPLARYWLRWFDLECSEECGLPTGHPCETCGDPVAHYDCTGKAANHEDCEVTA